MDFSSFQSTFTQLWGPRAVRRPLRTEVAAALPAPRLPLRALPYWHISQHAPGRGERGRTEMRGRLRGEKVRRGWKWVSGVGPRTCPGTSGRLRAVVRRTNLRVRAWSRAIRSKSILDLSHALSDTRALMACAHPMEHQWVGWFWSAYPNASDLVASFAGCFKDIRLIPGRTRW